MTDPESFSFTALYFYIIFKSYWFREQASRVMHHNVLYVIHSDICVFWKKLITEICNPIVHVCSDKMRSIRTLLDCFITGRDSEQKRSQERVTKTRSKWGVADSLIQNDSDLLIHWLSMNLIQWFSDSGSVTHSPVNLFPF